MDEKRCTKCKSVKPASAYHRTKSGKLQSWCRSCKAVQHRNARRSKSRQDDMRRFRTYRPPFGERSHKAKLRNTDVSQIKRLAGHLNSKVVAEKFGVYFNTIRNIWRGEYWTHI